MNIIEKVNEWVKELPRKEAEIFTVFLKSAPHLKSYGACKKKAFEIAKTIRMAANFASAAGRSPDDVFEELIHIYGITLLSGKIPEHELVKLLSLYDIHKFSEAPREMGPDDLLKVFNLIIQEYGKK